MFIELLMAGQRLIVAMVTALLVQHVDAVTDVPVCMDL